MSDVPTSTPPETTGAPEVPATVATDGSSPGPPKPSAGEAGRSVAKALLDAVLEGSSVVVTILAIFLAFVVGGLLIAFTDPTVLHAWGSFFSNPGNALAQTWDSAAGAYSAMLEGSIVDPHTVSAAFHGGSIAAVFNPLSETAVNATPLILAGLSFGVAARAGLFNIGAAGQFIGGAMIAGWIGFAVHLPLVIHVIVAVLGGFVGGAIVGWFVGFLKARTGAHEVITTIMLNYVMEYLILFLLGLSVFRQPGRPDPISPPIAPNAELPHLFGPNLRVNAGLLIALAAALGLWWLLERTTIGFQVRTVGANPSAARSAGMRPEWVWIIAMLVAGGLAGLAGSTVVQGTDFVLTAQIYGTYGFDAITVALLGRARPGGTVLAAFLFGALNAGGIQMQASTQIPVDIVTVIQSLVVLFVAAPPFIREVFRLKTAKAKAAGEVEAKGWAA